MRHFHYGTVNTDMEREVRNASVPRIPYEIMFAQLVQLVLSIIVSNYGVECLRGNLVSDMRLLNFQLMLPILPFDGLLRNEVSQDSHGAERAEYIIVLPMRLINLNRIRHLEFMHTSSSSRRSS